MVEKQRTQLVALGELAHILGEVSDGAPLPGPDRLGPLLDRIHPADLADLIEAAPDEAQLPLFEMIPDDEDAAEVLACVDDSVREELFERLSLTRKAELVRELAPDEAADVLVDLPEGEQDRVLAELDAEEAADLRELASHAPDTAGGIMSSDFVAVPQSATARVALMEVRTHEEGWDDLVTVFVVDDHERLVGVIDLDDLLRADPRAVLESIMEGEPVFARVDEDQEDVAQRAAHYRLAYLPVVDAEDVLVGVISADDVMETLGEEASEDMFRLAGSLEHHPTRESTFDRLLHRFPFLLVTVAGTYLVAFVIKLFDPDAEQGVLRFIPMIAALAGNAGLQASTTMIRGFATGEVRLTDFRWVFRREVSLGFLTGAAAAVVEFLLLIVDEPWTLCWVVPLSQALSVVLATVLGTVIPFACLRARFRFRGREFRIDPALAAGPFITTLNDIASTAIALILFTPNRLL